MLIATLLIAASPPQAPATSSVRTCYFSVDGKVRVNGRCLVFPLGGHGYTLNTWDRGKPRASHFVQVDETSPGLGIATWNRDPGDDRAGDPLGIVRWQKGCWVNSRVKICSAENERVTRAPAGRRQLY
jgi:hypothetical protein